MNGTPFIPTDPPAGFPSHLLPVFFLITSIFRNDVVFLVFFNGRREWLMLDQMLIHTVRELQKQISIGEIDWQRLCQNFLTNITTLPFHLNQSIQKINWNDVIFLRRRLQIRLENGTQVLAKYVENFGEMWCENSRRNEHHIRCQISGTNEEVIIPISAIVNHIPSSIYINQYNQKLAEKKAEEKLAIDAKAAAEASEAYRQQMINRGSIVGPLEIQHYYPSFSIGSLQALSQLCKKFGIVPDFTHVFNLIVDRFQKFGDHSSFAIQQLSEDDQKSFDAFLKKYMNEIVGRVIRSKTARFKQSKLPVHLFRVFEYYCYLFKINSPTHQDIDDFLKKGDEYFKELATNMITKSGNPLEFRFPDEYWICPEFHVLRKPLRNAMFQTLLEMPKDMNFPADVFVSE